MVMRSRFDQQLAILNEELISMGALCEESIALAAKSLTEGDARMAEGVAPLDNEIDKKERDIETLCLKLLLHQQPVARDLRQISAALKMITDMERIGDQSADIAEVVTMGSVSASDETPHIGDMARTVIKMVTDSIDAFVRRDVDAARAVIACDDVVDGLFNQVKCDLVARFGRCSDKGECALDLLMIAKYFERTGDHAVNIAEWVVFSITGRHEEDPA